MSHRTVPVTLKFPGDATALIVGGGRVAASRTRWLLSLDVAVRVVAPAFCDELRALGEDPRVSLQEGLYAPGDLSLFALVIAATDKNDINRRVHDDAVRSRVPVNVADTPSLCTFEVPATVIRGPLRVSVSSSGESPALAVRLRQALETALPIDWEALVEWFGRARLKIRSEANDTATGKRIGRRLSATDVYQSNTETSLFDLESRLNSALAQISEEENARTVSSRGFVWLVGAGPGDPGLITEKGRQVLGSADAVLFDGLVHPEILRHARRDAEFFDTSKRVGCKDFSQDAINALMVNLASEGKWVCRLKGGDPCVFGRGGEEALILSEKNIPFAFVPGVTSAVAAPELAGIPLTHRDHASYFQVITGHEDPRRTESRLNWGDLSRSEGTLVFLMGAHRLTEICTALTAHGKGADTPVAVVCRGTLPDQEVFVTTLGEAMRNQFETQRVFPRPALIVVGSVVSLREKLVRS